MGIILGTAVFQHDWQQNIIFNSSTQKDIVDFNKTFSFNSTGGNPSGVFYEERTLSNIDSVTYDLKNLKYNLIDKSVDISYLTMYSMFIQCTGADCWVSGSVTGSNESTVLGHLEASTGNFPYGIMHKLPYMIIKPTGMSIAAMTGITIHQLTSGADNIVSIGMIGITG